MSVFLFSYSAGEKCSGLSNLTFSCLDSSIELSFSFLSTAAGVPNLDMVESVDDEKVYDQFNIFSYGFFSNSF